VPGLAPGCTVLSVPIFEDAPGRPAVCTQEELAAGIHGALDRHANVINISAAQQADLLSLSRDLGGALEEAAARDVLVVAAAGNHGCACDTIPASVPGVLAVGAHDDTGAPLISSNWGPQQRAQGLTAPGAAIPGACVGGGLCRASGTSFATAAVSGVAALLMSIDKDRGIAPSGQRVRRALLASCAPPSPEHVVMASAQLSGRLDVARAVDHLLGTSASASPGESMVTMSSAIQDGLRQPGTNASRPAGATVAEAEAPPRPMDTIAPPARGLVPADCGCGCGGDGGECTCKGGKAGRPQLVYAIGRLGVSFVSQARRDSIWRTVNGGVDGDLKPITDAALRDLFKKQPFQAQSVVWTLSRTEVPMYVIVPTGAFAAETYKWLAEEWSDKEVEFVSIPGVLAGQVALYDGQIVDAVVPDLRGMLSWQTKIYVKALTDATKKAQSGASAERIHREVGRFLSKIYFSVRNRGQTPEERALNAAATNAFNISPVIVEAAEEGMALRDIAVERSPLNRPGSEYLDVLITFFDPQKRAERAPLRARFTIDVSDTVPVMIGEPVTWNEY
jgi:cyanobactin maturation PatA/PatG family protease